MYGDVKKPGDRRVWISEDLIGLIYCILSYPLNWLMLYYCIIPIADPKTDFDKRALFILMLVCSPFTLILSFGILALWAVFHLLILITPY